MNHGTQYSYDKLGQLLTMTQGAGQIGVYAVNGSGQAYRASTGSIVQSYSYDELGRRKSETDGAGGITSYQIDLRGNIVATTRLGITSRAAYNAQDRKTAESDPNLAISQWVMNYHGQVTTMVNGAGTHSYTYNLAGALTLLTSTRGQHMSYTYDGAGQLTRITDSALNQVTTYQYDLAGNHVREKTTQAGITYQDNHLAYDALGRLRDVADGRAHVTIDYDKVGNRTLITTHVNTITSTGDTSQSTARHFQYDAMNRQTVVDGVDAQGNIGQQGHLITYDKNGNRTSDTSWGNRVTSTGAPPEILYYGDENQAVYSEETTSYQRSEGFASTVYRYDALNRLTSAETDGIQLDARLYDGAGRVIKSGPGHTLHQNYINTLHEGVPLEERIGAETRINSYNANGRLVHQKVLNTDGSARSDTQYTGIDAAGNITGYQVVNREGGNTSNHYTNTYSIQLERLAGYQQKVISGTSTKFQSGTTTQSFDANGHLVGVDDSTMNANDKSFINDVNGQALLVNQNGNVMRQLIVNGEVLGRFGVGVDQVNPRDNRSNPNFTNIVDWEFGYQGITASYPNAAPGAYTTRTGDTLKSIAQSAYGDSSLWYVIAQANGMSSDSDLRAGQTINIPNQVTGASNNATTFQPYDPSRIEGDKTPNLPQPPAASNGGGCGGLGKLLMVIVTVVVAIYAPQLLASTGAFGQTTAVAAAQATTAATAAGVSSAGVAMSAGAAALSSGLGGIALGAASAALGSIASQMVGIATGVQDSFSWKGVALGALSGGINAGVSSFLPSTGNAVTNAVVRTTVGNALTQGVAVTTGLQDKFSWKGVAASGIGAGVGSAIGGALGGSADFKDAFGSASNIAARAVGGLAGGLTTAALRGGRVSATQVMTDVFGQVVGESLAEGMSSAGTTAPPSQGVGPYSAGDYVNGMDVQSDLATMQRQGQPYYDQVVEAFSRTAPVDPSDGLTLAAGQGFSLGREVSGSGAYTGQGLKLSAGYAAAFGSMGNKASSNEDSSFGSAMNWLTESRASGRETYTENIEGAGSGLAASLYTMGRALNGAGYDLGQGAVTLYGLATDGDVRSRVFSGIGSAVGSFLDNPLGTVTRGGYAVGHYFGNTSLGQMGEDALRFGSGTLAGAGFGKLAGAAGSLALDATGTGLRYTLNALPESSFNGFMQASNYLDKALYRLNPTNYEWSGMAAGTLGAIPTPIGLKLSGVVEVRVPMWASAAQKADYALYTRVANEALKAGYLSPTGRVSTSGALRQMADVEIDVERALARAQGRVYQGVVGHGPDTTWTGKPSAYRWLDQDSRVNSSLGGQSGRYPIGFKPTGFVLKGFR